jgi:hypothetical protein
MLAWHGSGIVQHAPGSDNAVGLLPRGSRLCCTRVTPHDITSMTFEMSSCGGKWHLEPPNVVSDLHITLGCMQCPELPVGWLSVAVHTISTCS